MVRSKRPIYLYLLTVFALVIVPACRLVTGPRQPQAQVPTPIEATVSAPTQPILTLPAPGALTPTPLVLPTQSVDSAPQPQRDDAPTAEPKSLLENTLPKAELVAETEHFRFYAQDDYIPVDQEWWTEQAEVLYDYVSERLDGAQSPKKIELAFTTPETRECPVRGLASSEDGPVIIIYADETYDEDYLLGVLSHEIGHAISGQGFPDGLPDHLGLTEGLATWASGKYWLAWKDAPSFEALMQQYIEEGVFEPPTQNYNLEGIYPWDEKNIGPDCLERRDRVYSAWGSFLGYLIETYGWDKAHQLFQQRRVDLGNRTIIYPPDYEGIYGKAINQLEADWLATFQGS